jgi:hypothetical protein
MYISPYRRYLLFISSIFHPQQFIFVHPEFIFYTLNERLLREVGWDGRDWIDLAQDRDRWRAYVNAVMNLRVP